ncbi:putative conserved tandem protein 10 [Amphidinium carterae]
MKSIAAACVLALLGLASIANADVSVNQVDDVNRPVSKVILLLKDVLLMYPQSRASRLPYHVEPNDMQKQLEKEQEEDEEIYEKLACWCETNDKEKTKAIADAEAKIEDLQIKIEELTATSAKLNTEIAHLESEVKKNQESLDQATALRQKQMAEFNAEDEKDLLESIKALGEAIVVLSKHHGGSFFQAQAPRGSVMGVAATLQREYQTHERLLQGALTRSERRKLEAFIQAPQDYFDAKPTFKQAYAPQSGEIFGILKQMKETFEFEANLSDAQKEELANQKAYEELKAAKLAQIAAAKEQIETKTQLADTDLKNAQAKEDVADTKASLSADEQYLMMLKEKCAMTDKEWEQRQKTRQMEMQAVSKALVVLSSDESHDLFTRTFNPALVQKDSVANSGRRAQAAELLAAVAKKVQNPRLATLATRVRLDAFTKVKKAIDDMVAQLLKEKEDEIKHRDFCTKEFNENQLQTERKDRDEQDTKAKIEDLEMFIKQLTEDIERLKSEIADMQVQLKRAGEDREKQNKEFQTVVSDQRSTQSVLMKAMTILKQFYAEAKAKEADMLQMKKQEPVGPPPPPGFKDYEKNTANIGVLGLLEQILADAKAMEKDTIKDENDAQKAYEDFVKETNSGITARSKEISDKSEQKGKAEIELAESKEDLDAIMTELEQLSNYKAQLHTSCDFVMKNFEIRQTGRDQEIEALKQAKAILSGAKFQAAMAAA